MRTKIQGKPTVAWQWLKLSRWRILATLLCVFYVLDMQPRQAAAVVRKHQRLWDKATAGKLFNYFSAGTGMGVAQQDPNKKVGQPNKVTPPPPNIPLTILQGGDTQALATPICALPFNAAGTTVGAVDNFKLPANVINPTMTGSCATIANGAGPTGSMPRGAVYTGTMTGPDVVYSMTFPTGNPNTLTISMDPTGAQDLALVVYCNTVSNLPSDGLVVSDTGVGGQVELVTVGNIAAGTTLYIVVDGYSSGGTPPGPSGAYTLQIISNGATQPNCGAVAPTITKAFAPAVILSGGTSTATLTLNNSNATALTGGAFTDTLIGMSAVGGPVGGSCVGTLPASLSAGATALSFTGIGIPASSSCTVSFPVTSSTLGERPNVTSGVTTTEVPTAGAASNTAILTVLAAPTIGKAFSPPMITAGATSMVTLTLSNAGNPFGLVGAFTDTLVNMMAVGGPIGGTCGTLAAVNIPANATNLSFSGIAMPANGSCMVSFPVRSNVAGMQPNTTSGMTTDFTGAATGPPSNTAVLTVNAPTMQTIAKAFSPTSIVSGGQSTVTLTLSNTLPFGVLASFTDALTNMTAVGGPIGSTCGTLATITVPANATNVSFSGIVIPGAGSCAVSFAVTSNVVGVNPNTTSGITTDQSAVPGPPSNTVNLTVTASLQPTLASRAVRNDFDGDGKSDLARWNSESGEWQVTFSSDDEQHRIQLVESNDKDEYVAVAADFDGDRKTDAAVFRPNDGRWLIKRSSDGELVKAQFGLSGDTPMAADFDGDGRADLAVWRNGDGLHIQRSSDQTEQAVYLGQAGDVPVIGDYDGDGLTDVAVFSAGHWLLRSSATGSISDELFGQVDESPTTADFDGDGKDDLMTLRPAEGVAYARRSSDQEVQRIPLGNLTAGESAVFGDYDGDGRAEPAIWRNAKAAWDILFRQTPR